MGPIDLSECVLMGAAEWKLFVRRTPAHPVPRMGCPPRESAQCQIIMRVRKVRVSLSRACTPRREWSDG